MSHFLTFFLLFSYTLIANDLGTYGETFPIQEEDFIKVLKNRLANSQLDEKKKQELQQTFAKTIENPKGKIMEKAQKRRNFEFDPTLCVSEDIKDQNGKIIVHKGTLINPLDTNCLLEDLIFFDGNDIQQIQWAKNLKGKWILTNGDPLQLEEQENRPVYFDQNAYLTKKLGIHFLPAKVSQNGKRLQIEEIPCL